MRLIDADEIRNKLKRKEINPATIFINEVLIGLLDDAPTVDAVPIVRCGDCKHCYVGGELVRYNACDLYHVMVQKDDWFCADAQERGEQ